MPVAARERNESAAGAAGGRGGQTYPTIQASEK